ncbi:type VI secretion system Vgr family protein [Paraburkholderia sp. BCC1876]|uniref:type VI secretion system Vgr family protein n=1 Tax=Paraburkholderia sp. BCC1876 TaxID=2676303 RepID=UPI001590CFB9|nr:type VI secretion system Vgr family protein [Paraburkholderia sp. BCC1876]
MAASPLALVPFGNPLEALSGAFRNFDQLVSSFTQSQRQLQVSFSPDAGLPTNAMLPHQLTGNEGICAPLDYTLSCLSTDTRLPLKTLIGVPVAFRIGDFTGSERVICAIVTGARQLASDGGFVLNEYTCEDGLSILRHRTTWRVFRNSSVIDITQEIFEEHLGRNSVLASAFTFDIGGLKSTYPTREFTMQSGESDLAFLSRLWRREGICWYFSHAVNDGWPVHKLHLVDSPTAWQDNPSGTVRFHRADATEKDDTINVWQAFRALAPGAAIAAAFDFRTGRADEVSETNVQDQGKHGKALSSTLTEYLYDAPHIADDSDHYRQINLRRQQAREQLAKHFAGESVVRAFSGGVGTVFSLAGQAEIDLHPLEQRRFVLTRVETSVRNHLLTVSPAGGDIALGDESPAYLNRFECIRADIPVVPAWDPACVPAVGPMSAIVVGAPGLEIDVDKLGRIAVQFLFARSEEHPRAGASGTPRDSARVRLALPWADQGAGTALTPRVGSEVLVTFLQNDPDKPVVIANLHGANRTPTQFSGAGSLPGNAALYGIRSKEVSGSGYGELLFDDTTGQTKTKLSSEHGKTQLNEGWIGHPRDGGKSDKRGEGFELRTDMAGAIRAAQGLLISTDNRAGAKGQVLDRQELVGQLEAALAIAKQLADLSSSHQADGTDTAPQGKLLDKLKQWDSEKPGGAPLIGVSAPDGVALASPLNIVASAGTHVDVTAIQDVNVSAGRKILLRAAQGLSAFAKAGMKLIAGSGDVVVQAQQGTAEIGASDRLHLYSLKDLLIEAPNIVLKANGVTYSLGDGKVLASSSGEHKIETSSFSFTGGGGGSPDLPHMPVSTMKTNEQFAIANRAGEGLQNLEHRVVDETGAVRDSGRLGADGTHGSIVQDSQIRPLTIHPLP